MQRSINKIPITLYARARVRRRRRRLLLRFVKTISLERLEAFAMSSERSLIRSESTMKILLAFYAEKIGSGLTKI